MIVMVVQQLLPPVGLCFGFLHSTAFVVLVHVSVWPLFLFRWIRKSNLHGAAAVTTSDARNPNPEREHPHTRPDCVSPLLQHADCTVRFDNSAIDAVSENVYRGNTDERTDRRKALDRASSPMQILSVWLVVCRTSGHFQTTLLMKESR